jgi:A/G-specific adenine glycosylase
MPKKDIPHHVHAAAVVVGRIANPPHVKVLLTQRPSTGLLGGMWEFPNGRVQAGQDPAKELAKVLKSGYGLRLGAKRNVPIGVFQHAYTHFKVTVHAFLCEPAASSTPKNMKWVALKDLNDYPMGRVDRQIANAITHGVFKIGS